MPSRVDVRRALTELSADREAGPKIGVGLFVVSLPILNIAAVGYEVQLARTVAAGAPPGLPDWDDPLRLFRMGLGLALARMVYDLPAGLLTVAGVLLAARPLLPALRAGPLTLEHLRPALGQAALAALVAGVLWLAYSLLDGLLSPAVMAQWVQHGTFRACFDLGSMISLMRRNWGAYSLVWGVWEAAGLVTRAAGFLVGLLGPIPVVGPLIGFLVWGWLTFASMLLHGHLVGQLVRTIWRRPNRDEESAREGREYRRRRRET